jgi:hypothetical protein
MRHFGLYTNIFADLELGTISSKTANVSTEIEPRGTNFRVPVTQTTGAKTHFVIFLPMTPQNGKSHEAIHALMTKPLILHLYTLTSCKPEW